MIGTFSNFKFNFDINPFEKDFNADILKKSSSVFNTVISSVCMREAARQAFEENGHA